MTAKEPDPTIGLVGFDGSKFAWEALRWAADEAGRRRADLEVVMGCPPPQGSTTAGPPLISLQQLVDEATRVAARRGWQIRVGAAVASGRPGDALVDRARGAALLVLGEHDPLLPAPPGRESLSRCCATNATCPVIVVTSVSQPPHGVATGLPVG